MADDLTISLKSDIAPTQLGYFPPSWSSMPKKKYSIDVWKEGTIVKSISLHDKEYYVIGRNNAVCDITLAHPTVSRVHCVLQHRDNGYLYIYDLKTAYGTFVNKNKIDTQSYIKIGTGETFKIANSTKMFILNCEEEAIIKDNTQGATESNLSKTIQQLLQSNNDIPHFNNESHWGIEENDEEIMQHQFNEENNDDNDINVNELLLKDNLTMKQRSLIEKITQLLSERDNIIKERETMKYVDYDDNDTQKKQSERKKYYFTKRLGEIKESVDTFKQKLVDSLKATDENSQKFNMKIYKQGNKDDDDDEYYDRTNSFIPKEENTGVINYESMKAALEGLIKEKQKLTDLLSHTDTDTKLNLKAKEEEIDTIDQYFIDNEIETKTENIKDKLESIENEIKKTEQLLDYVTPLHLKIKRNAESNSNSINVKNIPKDSFMMPSNSIIKSNKQSNKKKESIAEVMSKMNKIQSTSHNMLMNNSEGNEGLVNDIEAIEDNNEVQLDDEMIDKLNEYKILLARNEDKDKKKQEQEKSFPNKKKEANLFKEIVANIGKSNFEVSNYPQINSRYESLREGKEKKDNKRADDNIIPLDDDDDDHFHDFQGKKRPRDEIQPKNCTINQDKSDRQWVEETISDNPFSKYLDQNDNQS